MSEWYDKAACKAEGVETFYSDSPDKGINLRRESNAKNVCRKCPVAAECLMHAIDKEEKFGVWGSFTPKERSTLVSIFSDKSIDINLCKRVVNKEIRAIKANILRREFGIR
jgi:WhiB family redox-sensing transcriptional regulator